MPAIKKDSYDHGGDGHDAAVEWYSRIMDSIIARDPDAAREAMTRHLEIAMAQVPAAGDTPTEGDSSARPDSALPSAA